MAPKHRFITGGTGFLGAHFIVRLLLETDDELYCLSRANGHASGAERLREKLREVASSVLPTRAARLDLEQAFDARVVVLDGDVTEPGLGLSAQTRAALRIDEVFHLAARVSFLNAHRADVFRANVDGSRNVLDLVAELGNPVFNYVSTAYVAGARRGPVPEGPFDASFPPNNPYEESKRVVEDRILELHATSGLRYRIFRPSIIVGHSETLEPESSTGLYGYLGMALSLRQQFERSRPGYFDAHRIRVLADPNPQLNLVCVDHVAELMHAVAANDSSLNDVYHLVSPTSVDIAAATERSASDLGLRFDFVTDRSGFTPVDYLLGRRVERFNCYLVNISRFELGKVLAYASKPAAAYAVDEVMFQKLTARFCRSMQLRARATSAVESATSEAG